jgi:hypothetical protein
VLLVVAWLPGLVIYKFSFDIYRISFSDECCPPSMEKRQLMNLILLGSTGLTVGTIGVPALLFFVPPGSGGGSGGLPALDANGQQVYQGDWLQNHLANDR